MMDGVRTVNTPELSAEAIEAARQRRAASNRFEPSASDLVEARAAALPKNHPWATAKGALSEAEAAAKRSEVLQRNQPRKGSSGEGEAA